jgi:hypothetical protein
MFDQVFGLPAHALIIHAAVAVTPLLAVLAIVYAVLPRWRHKIDWAAVLSAVAAPVAVFAARESGEKLEHRLFNGNTPEAVEHHESFALPLLTFTILLAVATLVLVYLTRARRAPARRAPAGPAGGPRSGAAGVVTLGLSVVTVVLALLVAFYVLQAGHSGATAVWGG